MSRGVRNNNPGNIRRSAVKYRGEKHPSTDPAFKQFESAAWGYRAMFVVLHTYRQRHGLKTLSEMIGRYAPPAENATDRYVAAVARESGIAADQPLHTLDRTQMTAIVAAMSRVENGVPADPQEVAEGWELFKKHKP